MKSKAFILTIILFSLIASASITTVVYEASGLSRFRLTKNSTDMRKISTTTQDYELFRTWSPEGGDQLYLIGTRIMRSYFLESEGVSGEASWTVRTGPHLEQKVWGKTEPATVINFNHDWGMLVSGLEGCCSEMTGYRLHEVATGKLLMSFNSFSEQEVVRQPFSLEIPNSPLRVRFVGGLSKDSTRDQDFRTFPGSAKPVLLLKYGNPYMRQKLQVNMETAEGYAASVLDFKIEKDPTVGNSHKVEIRDNKITLWNIDGSSQAGAVEGVLLRVVLNGGLGDRVLKIPIKGDRLSVESAEIPSSVQVHSISL